MKHVYLSAIAATLLLGSAGAALAAPADTAPADAAQTQPKLELGTGASYFTGDYGSSVDTQMLYAPLTAVLRSPTWHLDATVPYLSIKGPGNVVGAGGTPIVVQSSSTAVTTRSGLGDAILGGAVFLPHGNASLPFLELAGKVKLPTAETGLGTGRTDYTTQMNLYQTISPQLTLLASAGYQWLGSSATYRLKDGAVAMAGFNYKAARTTDLGATFNYGQSVMSGVNAQTTVVPYLAWRPASHWGLTAYTLAGLTKASPRFGGGLQLTFYP